MGLWTLVEIFGAIVVFHKRDLVNTAICNLTFKSQKADDKIYVRKIKNKIKKFVVDIYCIDISKKTTRQTL